MGRRRLERLTGGVLVALAVVALMVAATLSGGDTEAVSARPAAAGPVAGLPGEQPRPVADRRAAPSRPVQFVPVVPAGRPAVNVPILMYHYIRINPDPRDTLGFDLSVTPADFTAQMDWLAANGYHPIDFDDLRGYLMGGGTLPDRPIVLTFDDGYADLYTTAFPILRAHHFKAVSYVVAGFVNAPRYITSDQVLEMDAHGIEIGDHTFNHVDLTAQSPAELWHQIHDSKVWLEGLLGHPVVDFCYPSGRFNDAVVRAVQAAGFLTATTTLPGRVHSASDRLLWTRVRLAGGETLGQLVADLGVPEATSMAAQAPPARVPLHGPAKGPVTVPLLPPRAALPAAQPLVGAFP